MDFQKTILDQFIKRKYELALFGLMGALFIINSYINNWLFWESANDFMIDKWIYEGYSLYYGDFIHYFGSTYYAGRVSWIFPGVLAHSLFSPLIGRYILHFVFFIVAAFALFYSVKMLFKEKTAFITTVLMICYPEFIHSMGTDYPIPAIITFLLLTILMVVYSSKYSHWKLGLVFAGIFCTSMIYAQMFSVIFLPSIILLYYFLNKTKRNNPVIPSALYFISGFIIISIIYSAISFALSGNSDFISVQLSSLIYYSDVKSDYYQPVLTWIGNAYYLVIPAIVLIGSLIYAFRQRNNFRLNQWPPQTIIILNYIFACLLFIVLQFKPNPVPVFAYWYYADDLIPLLFLALAAFIYPVINTAKVRTLHLFYALIVVLSILPFFPAIPAMIGPLVSAIHVSTQSLAMILIIVGIFFFTSIVYLGRKKTQIILSLCSLCLIMTTLLFYPLVSVAYVPPEKNEHYYTAAMETTGIIHEKIPKGNVRFWYNSSESYGGIFNTINSVYLWGYTWISRDFPNIEKKNIDTIFQSNKEMNVVILSDSPDALAAADSTLRQYGYSYILHDSGHVQNRQVKFDYYILSVRQI